MRGIAAGDGDIPAEMEFIAAEVEVAEVAHVYLQHNQLIILQELKQASACAPEAGGGFARYGHAGKGASEVIRGLA
jgi:hypothetical protein